MFDARMLAASTAKVVHKALAPIMARLAALEALQLQPGIKGDPGEPGRDGKDVDMDLLREMTAEMIGKILLDAIDAAAPSIARAAAALVPAPENGAPGQDGKDADMDLLLELAAERIGHILPDAIEAALPSIARAAAEIVPPPEKGEKGDPGESIKGDPGTPGRDGKDGIGMAGALIDRDGQLVVTLTDGSARALGMVLGRDGEKGADGQNGRDGFSLTDFDTGYDGERTLTLKFAQGAFEYEHQLHLPIVIDRGVWQEGRDYEGGDGVTWGGSWWIAQRATGAKPDSADSGWRLAVKKGRDGKDAPK